jgi:hypothetical protein
MNAVVYQRGTNKVKHFVRNCVKRGNKLVGDNATILINARIFDTMWTDEILTPIMSNNEIVGWDKNVSDLTPSAEVTEIKPPGKAEFIAAMKIRKLVDNLTYQELEDYIENNVTDLASAKEFMKTQSKVILALCKIVDSK